MKLLKIALYVMDLELDGVKVSVYALKLRIKAQSSILIVYTDFIT